MSMGLAWRVYEDYLMGSRLPAYERLLRHGLGCGYNFRTFADFWSTRHTPAAIGTKTILLRHDIDSDNSTAREMFEIERRLGIRSSYYFRLKTIDSMFMRRIASCGSEASYHYEELSSFARVNGIIRAQELRDRLDETRAIFATNIRSLRVITGQPMCTVASHGDFLNRRLGIRNLEILADANFRADLGVEVELYDDDLMCLVGSRHADLGQWQVPWVPPGVAEAIASGTQVVYLLVHPKHWRSNPRANFFESWSRVSDDFAYRRAVRRRRRPSAQ